MNIFVITGHYGAGKTNFTINLALAKRKEGKTVTVADLDIVNPYFRVTQYEDVLTKHGVDLVTSVHNRLGVLDIPSLQLNIRGEAAKCDCLILDTGGDDEGARVLGRYAAEIKELLARPESMMIYVINRYRYLTRTAEECVRVMREIETVTGLKHTHVFDNSHLCDTDVSSAAEIEETRQFVADTARLAGVPELSMLSEETGQAVPITVYVTKPW